MTQKMSRPRPRDEENGESRRLRTVDHDEDSLDETIRFLENDSRQDERNTRPVSPEETVVYEDEARDPEKDEEQASGPEDGEERPSDISINAVKLSRLRSTVDNISRNNTRVTPVSVAIKYGEAISIDQLLQERKAAPPPAFTVLSKEEKEEEEEDKREKKEKKQSVEPASMRRHPAATLSRPTCRSAAAAAKDVVLPGTERSKRLRCVFEDGLGMVHAQVGFPLYPVESADTDVLLVRTLNTGYLGHLAKNATRVVGAGVCSSKVKSISDFGFDVGLSYEITHFGESLGSMSTTARITSLPGCQRQVTVRRIDLVKNPAFSPDCNKPGTSPGPAVVYHTLASIAELSIVSEMAWRQLCVLLSKQHCHIKPLLLDNIRTPRHAMPSVVTDFLADRRNADVADRFNQLRRDLNAADNPAYMSAMIQTALGWLSAKDWTTLFPKVFETARGQSLHAIPDPQVAPLWTQYILTQHVESYHDAFLAMQSELNSEVLLAHLFQVVFGLDYAQETLGFIHRNLDVAAALGYVGVDPKLYMYYFWRGAHYRVPTYGRVMKIRNMQWSSIVLNGVRHNGCSMHKSSHHNHMMTQTHHGDNVDADEDARGRQEEEEEEEVVVSPKLDSYNTDLIRLGATMQRVLQDKQMRLVAPRGSSVPNETLLRMLQTWSDCVEDVTPAASPAVGRCAADDHAYRYSCFSGATPTSEDSTCTWNAFFDIPSHTDCRVAVPSQQKHFFRLFEVTKEAIPPDANVYTLAP